MAIYELGEDRRKTNLNALLQAAQLAIQAKTAGQKSSMDQLSEIMLAEKLAAMQKQNAIRNTRLPQAGGAFIPSPITQSLPTGQQASSAFSNFQSQRQLNPNPVMQPNDLVLKTITDSLDQDTGALKTNTVYENPMAELQKKQADALAEGNLKNAQSLKATAQSAEIIGSAASRFDDQWVKSVLEGGSGDAIKDWTSKAAIRAGGKIGDNYRQTSALEGLKTEFITRYMPLLTQQGDKEGSVRLVETVFRKIGTTLPKGYSGIGAAYDQLATTFENAMGYAKAFQQNPLSKQDIDAMSDKQLNTYVDTLKKVGSRIRFTPEEKRAIEASKETAFKNHKMLMQVEKMKGKKITKDVAAWLLQQADGDKDTARRYANNMGLIVEKS